MKHLISVSLLALGITLGMTAVAQDRSTSTPSQSPREESNSRQRADQQGADQTSKADRELAAAVRRAITSDQSLSREAHNVKIDVQGGTVMLSGKVKSSEEKSTVAAAAKTVTNVQNVDDQLIVDPDNR